jgi:acyl-CoA synthetase (AMP-forming)/AMP-acid ligase II
LEQEGRVAPPAVPAEGRQLVGCGEPSWEVEIAILDPETGRRRGPDETGEVWISGKSVASGYWRNEAATTRSLRARLDDAPGKTFLRTGDLGFVGKQDKQLYICGRLKDLIICDGRNLHPEDIEYSIARASDALKPQSCAVFSHEDANQKVCIVVAIEVDRELKRRLAGEPKPLQAAIRASVANDHGVTLSQIVFVLPSNMRKTTSGKIQRGLMRQLYLDGELEALQP